MIIDEYELRAMYLERFLRGATALLEARPALASVQLGVVQVYNDEASDAVQQHLQMSKSWQVTYDEMREEIYPPPFHMGWEANELAVHAFAALCDEGDPDAEDDYASVVSRR